GVGPPPGGLALRAPTDDGMEPHHQPPVRGARRIRAPTRASATPPDLRPAQRCTARAARPPEHRTRPRARSRIRDRGPPPRPGPPAAPHRPWVRPPDGPSPSRPSASFSHPHARAFLAQVSAISARRRVAPHLYTVKVAHRGVPGRGAIPAGVRTRTRRGTRGWCPAILPRQTPTEGAGGEADVPRYLGYRRVGVSDFE